MRIQIVARGSRARIVWLAVVAALGLGGCRQELPPVPVSRWQDAAPTQGTLRVLQLGSEERGSEPERFGPIRTTFVRGAQYAGHEDNDLRGNLDGTFKWGWNQPGQIHVRVGRRSGGAAYGELELFRVLHRFADLDVPRDAEISAASLELRVEEGADHPIRLVLYEIYADFAPGAGGTQRDNVSPPATGEVWWNDRAYPDEPWGMPGVGAAGERASGADTPEMPLAAATYVPGSETIRFASRALARYVERRVAAGAPLLFLLKLTDRHEDLPGSTLTVFAASHGEDRTPLYRPRLEIEWTSARARALLDEEIQLERGRSVARTIVLEDPGPLIFDYRPNDDRPFDDRADAEPGDAAASRDEPGSGDEATARDDAERVVATIELRGLPKREADAAPNRASDPPSGWRAVPLGRPVELEPSWGAIEVRFSAVLDPIVLGTPFRTELRDTWIRSGAPETQRVEFVFTAPSGQSHSALATYAGDYRFTVEFAPDELGTWTYAFTQQFTEAPLVSPTGEFDVVPGPLENVIAQLAALRARIEAASEDERNARWDWFSVQLSKLERAGLQRMSARSFRQAPGRGLVEELRRVREALMGRAMPETLPLEPSPPAPWQRTGN